MMANVDAEAYRIRDTISETDQFYFAFVMLPVRQKRENELPRGCIRIGSVIRQLNSPNILDGL